MSKTKHDPKPTWGPDPHVRVRKEYHYLRRTRHDLRGNRWLAHYRWPERIERVHVLFFRKVSEVLFAWDPLKVKFALELGFGPEDIHHEYDPEAASLVLLTDRWRSPEQLEAVLRDVLGYWFGGLDEIDEYYTLLARDLWNAWRALQGLPPHVFADDIYLPPRQHPMAIFVGSEGEGSDVPP